MANTKDKLNLTERRFDDIRKECLKSIIDFFNKELADDGLDVDQKESLAVAKQCLEACYDIDESSCVIANDLIEVFHKLNIPPNVEKSVELETEAETFKVLGNECMKEGDYLMAVQHYTKAIRTFGNCAIYYCNRAAAYSRLERHSEAIVDCKDAIKLDPSYGKAYGRLGIAYSNMMMYKEASDAYKKALQLDPTNATYEANLKLAEEKLVPSGQQPGNFDFNSFMNNPALLNMASQMLNDPSFRNIVSGIMTSGPGGDPNLESFVEVGQQIAEQLQATSPNVLDNLRATFGTGPPGQSQSGDGYPPAPGSDPAVKKEEPKKE